MSMSSYKKNHTKQKKFPYATIANKFTLILCELHKCHNEILKKNRQEREQDRKYCEKKMPSDDWRIA